MNVGKIALILGGLVIIALLIFATVSNVLPATFEWFECAINTFLNPRSGGGLSTCEFEIQFDGFGGDR